MSKEIMMKKKIYLVGYASNSGGPITRTSEAPIILQSSQYLNILKNKGLEFQWHKMLRPDEKLKDSKLSLITELNKQLATEVYTLAKEKKFFIVIGGDHSSAIGTWSGAYHAYKNNGPLGLIWIDAHMDSHTPESSPSGNIHGMPLACLLGYGDNSLTTIMNPEPKLQPEHVCLIGVRSFERGEEALLKNLNVKIFFMKEVKERGLEAVMKDALQIVNQGTTGFGISLDIDAIDPKEAPGTGTLAPNGIAANDLIESLRTVAKSPNFLGCEIVEFDPGRDIEHKTEKLIPGIIEALTRRR